MKRALRGSQSEARAVCGVSFGVISPFSLRSYDGAPPKAGEL